MLLEIRDYIEVKNLWELIEDYGLTFKKAIEEWEKILLSELGKSWDEIKFEYIYHLSDAVEIETILQLDQHKWFFYYDEQKELFILYSFA